MPLARREFLALAAVGGAAATAGVLFGVFGLRHESSNAQALLEHPFTDLEGRIVRLSTWSSPVLLCNFWATWCEPCRKEIPLLISLRRQFAANGFEIAGIGVDRADKLQNFAKEYQISYPVLVAGADTTGLLQDLGDAAAALPYSVVFDSRRRVRYRKLGIWTQAELVREIKAAIG